jgi:hypothetical protein
LESEQLELELLATLPGARLAEQMAVIDMHVGLVLEAVQAELDGGWIGPEHSPLGRAQHEAAVERRIARRVGGDIQATIVEGRHFLTIAALADEYYRPVHVALTRASAANVNARWVQ